MAVAIEKRPIGVVLDTCVSATINQDYNSVYATVNKTSHGLSDGDYVYIQSNVENYNGFWKIEVTNTNEFILIDNPYVEWIVNADITYCPQVATHGFSCVHLPIVYELSNTRWPVNSIDTARTVSVISDDNGYVNLSLSGSLGTFEDLSFIKITNTLNSTYDGVYQILDKISTSNITINLSYSNATAVAIYPSASAQLYYSNYNIVVRVYAGLNAAHLWADQKPYELVATLELIPDTDNSTKFSINEFLKDEDMVTNNLLLATLPSNIDAFTQFYIEVAEQYDSSNGYTVTTFESGFASDQGVFEGYAVNAILPFKNIHSGYLSEYVMTNQLSKFLTLFAIPVLFSCSEDAPDCYQDISFIIKQNGASVIVSESYYTNSVLQTTQNTPLTLDSGVHRFPLNRNCAYDRLDVSLGIYGQGEEIITNYDFATDFTSDNSWTNEGSGTSWIYSAGIARAVLTGTNSSKELTQTFIEDKMPGAYQLFYSTYHTAIASESTHVIKLYNDGVLVQTILSLSVTWDSTGIPANDQTINFNTTAVFNSIKIVVTRVSGASPLLIDVTECSITDGKVSETKTFDIECGCSNQEIHLTWLNYLGGFEKWVFKGETEHTVDITNSGETNKNIFPEWPKSYGEHADTIQKQTFRESSQRKFIFSQHLTQDQADAIAYIKSSPLVQIVNSRQDRRTVLVDTDSFVKYKDGDKTYQISFNILYTDNIPSQRV